MDSFALIIIGVAAWQGWAHVTRTSIKRKTRRFEDQRAILTKDKILHEDSALVEKAEGRGDELIERIGRAIQEENIPRIVLSTREVSVDGGDRCAFLVAADEKFKGVETIVGTHNYGNRLDVVWYVIHDTPEDMWEREEKFTASWEKKHRKDWLAVHYGGGYVSPKSLGVRDNEELHNGIGLVVGVIRNEVENFKKGLNLDFSAVDSRTRGFVNLFRP